MEVINTNCLELLVAAYGIVHGGINAWMVAGDRIMLLHAKLSPLHGILGCFLKL